MAEERRVAAGAGRGTTDAVALLIELGRALKACRFYNLQHPNRKAALDRCFHAFSSGLGRSGPLELEIRHAAIRVAGRPDLVGNSSVDELACELFARGVTRLRLTPEIDRDGFGILVAALALDPDELAEAGGIEHLARAEGMAVNAPRSGDAPAAPPPTPLATAPPEASSAEEAPNLWPGDSDGRVEEDPDADLPMPKPQTTGADPLATLGGLLAGTSDTADGALQPEPATDRSDELVGELRSLDECRDDAAYAERIAQVAGESGAADPDACYRAILVLAGHATDPVRSERQRALAEEALFGLASGPRLEDVVSRACAPGPQSSVRATQILLQLGAHAVPGLMDALLAEGDPERRGQLNAILIAMGEKALPEVKASLEASEPDRARLATRLAGEMQNPACVQYLAALINDAATPIELVREAAKALVRIANPSAVNVLMEAVGGSRPELASATAFCLGATEAPRALEALASALRRGLRDNHDELARESLRALGRLGRGEAVPVLDEVLARRGFLGRRRLRDLKLAAVAALGRIPGDAARQALDAVAGSRGDPQLRRAARAALAHHGGR